MTLCKPCAIAEEAQAQTQAQAQARTPVCASMLAVSQCCTAVFTTVSCGKIETISLWLMHKSCCCGDEQDEANASKTDSRP